MVFIWALPPIVNGSVWKFLLGGDGLVNTLLMKSSLVSSPVPFLYDTKLALYSVAIVNCWAVIPFNALVLRAAFMNIPKETTEAAQLDGVSSFQEVRHIIIPSVRPTRAWKRNQHATLFGIFKGVCAFQIRRGVCNRTYFSSFYFSVGIGICKECA
jgi:ABC-type sugar transport system permease subunit